MTESDNNEPNPFVSQPDPGVLIQRLGGNANSIELMTFWSLEPAYPERRLRYHLGQLAMLHLMNRLAGLGCKVKAYICDAQSRSILGEQITRLQDDIATSEKFIGKLRDNSVDVYRMSQLVQTMHSRDGSAAELADVAVSGALRFRNFIQRERPPNDVIKSLPAFRTLHEQRSFDRSTAAYLAKLIDEFPRVPDIELLAALFASQRRPSWFDAFWLGELAAWMSKYAGANGSVILEANRSAYAWLTHRCFLRIGTGNGKTQLQWPRMCFVEPVLATNGRQPMQLSERNSAVFLHHTEGGLKNRLEQASAEALKSYRSWFMDDLPADTDDDVLRETLKQKVQALRAKFEDDFLVRKAQSALAASVPPTDVRIGLALSGGGFRATFFHLGVVRLLWQCNLLSKVSAVYSVSGGSILAAHLAKRWQEYTSLTQAPEEFMTLSEPLRKLAQSDVRGLILRRGFGWGWLSGWATRRLEHYYKTIAGLDFELQNLPLMPKFAFLATSMRTGKVVAFLREGFHDGSHRWSASNLPVARAVAASSAFPPVFPAVALSNKDVLRGTTADRPLDELITDGGVYDNLGLAKLASDVEERSDDRWCTVMLVSDASAPFESATSDRYRSLIDRGIRTTDILMKRVSNLEASVRTSPGASAEAHPYTVRATIDTIIDADAVPENGSFRLQDVEVQERTAGIRTDLDIFSDEEIASLVRHGYEVAFVALTRAGLLPQGFQLQDAFGERFPATPKFDKKALPDGRTEQEQIADLRAALKRSASRRVRLFNPADGFCWLVVILLIVVAATIVCLRILGA